MLNIYSRSDAAEGAMSAVHPIEPDEGGESGWCDITPEMVWIDLYNPDREEEHYVEGVVDLNLPTREDMEEIEFSSRLYIDKGAAFMTALLAFHGGQDNLQSGPVTFVLHEDHLITIRYIDPKSFSIFADRVVRQPDLCSYPAEAFGNLLDVLIDRTADLLERASGMVEGISSRIFAPKKGRNLEKVLRELGGCQSDTARIRDSLVSLGRLLLYARGLPLDLIGTKDAYDAFHEHLRTLEKDVASLNDHAGFVSGNIAYLHEAALGMINLEQNTTIKIVSVASVAFLPPTLIASLYGMNFEYMPELHQPWAYPVVVGAMIASAVGPLVWFRIKGWL
ncbi:magnesium transporter CorA family protein [Asticcacaulis sp. BYS171W]|uniref:Magnesium transporter CorA family protein n=1 Tax=Asticcacaulis aquaticus TaxID=2984212 RepID=A0ABT5HXE6_9CAUL|nr:magnesium transporter CorA family protein [Asticcacaulis aquaticus]MDC7684751.1 magnesium transporter CorA family protein [Asticcacaulis aquaticus]